MKRTLLLLLSVTLLGCAKTTNSSEIYSSSTVEYDYNDVEERVIEWKDVLSKDDEYHVYVYSQTCGHCKEIKQTVLEYAIMHENFYFVIFDKTLPIINNDLLNIGASNYETMGIVGTPTLFEIDNHIVSECYTGSALIIETLTNNYE